MQDTNCNTELNRAEKKAAIREKGSKKTIIILVLAAIALVTAIAVLVVSVLGVGIGASVLGLMLQRNSAQGVAERYMTYLVDEDPGAMLDLAHEKYVEAYCDNIGASRDTLEQSMGDRLYVMDAENITWEILSAEELEDYDLTYRNYADMYRKNYDLQLSKVTKMRIGVSSSEGRYVEQLYLGKIGSIWYVLNPFFF